MLQSRGVSEPVERNRKECNQQGNSAERYCFLFLASKRYKERETLPFQNMDQKKFAKFKMNASDLLERVNPN